MSQYELYNYRHRLWDYESMSVDILYGGNEYNMIWIDMNWMNMMILNELIWYDLWYDLIWRYD